MEHHSIGRTIGSIVAIAIAVIMVSCTTAVADALARWGPPIRISPRGVVDNGWIDAAGVFRTVGELAGRPHLTTVTRRGAGRPHVSEQAVYTVPLRGERTLAVQQRGPVRLTVLSPRGARLHSYVLRGSLPDGVFGFDSRSVVPLANGGALVCTDLKTGVGELVAVVSPGGSRLHVLTVRGGRGAAELALPDGGCFGADAAPRTAPAGVIFENGDAQEGSGATNAQLMLERLLPGPALSAPISVVPAGEMFTENDGMPAVAETSTGWVAVSWLETFHAVNTFYAQQNLRWVSPTGTLGPVIRLSLPSEAFPAAVTLAAVGATHVLVLINPESPNNRIYAERVDAPGRAGPRTVLFKGSKIVPPVMATNGHKVVAAWQAGGAVHASESTGGRWSAPAVVAHCTGLPSICPYRPGVAISRTGRAAVYFSLLPSIVEGLGGAVAFDF
jgi:hypothetical protein